MESVSIKGKEMDLVFRPASFNTNEWLETEHFKECQGKKQLNWPSWLSLDTPLDQWKDTMEFLAQDHNLSRLNKTELNYINRSDQDR